jgi:hypothetical protein
MRRWSTRLNRLRCVAVHRDKRTVGHMRRNRRELRVEHLRHRNSLRESGGHVSRVVTGNELVWELRVEWCTGPSDRHRVLEDASVSVATVGEISTGDRLGDFKRRKLVRVVTLSHMSFSGKRVSGLVHDRVECRHFTVPWYGTLFRDTSIRLLRVEKAQDRRIRCDRRRRRVRSSKQELSDDFDLAAVYRLQHRGITGRQILKAGKRKSRVASQLSLSCLSS